jgi:hypothetical protein
MFSIVTSLTSSLVPWVRGARAPRVGALRGLHQVSATSVDQRSQCDLLERICSAESISASELRLVAILTLNAPTRIARQHVGISDLRAHPILCKATAAKTLVVTLASVRFYDICRENEEPASGFEPLTCSLGVIGHALQGGAGGCKSPISKGVPFPCLAECCTVLRSRWYHSGIK